MTALISKSGVRFSTSSDKRRDSIDDILPQIGQEMTGSIIDKRIIMRQVARINNLEATLLDLDGSLEKAPVRGDPAKVEEFLRDDVAEMRSLISNVLGRK